MKRAFFLFALTAAMLFAAPFGHTAIIHLTASIDGLQEVPQSGQDALGGSGNAVLTFDTATNVLAFTIDYALNTGPATAAHFHGRRVFEPAGPGIASPTQFNIAGIVGTSSGTVSGTFDFDTDAFLGALPGVGTLTRAERIDDLLNDLWYINIHTARFPSGEVRGQVLAVPEPGMPGLLLLGLAALVVSLRRRRA